MDDKRKPNDPAGAELALRIFAVLSSHRGAARAVTAAEIARRIQLDDPEGTEVRAILARELEFCPEPVLACGRGYYLIETGEEATDYLATLMSRLKKIGRRMVTVKRLLLAAGWQRDGLTWTPPAARPGAPAAAPAGKLFDDSASGFDPQPWRPR